MVELFQYVLMADHPLTILGASARAAAQSARRAGFAPHAIDLFGDADLREVATVATIERYPAGFLPALTAAPEGPWVYTGGLENYPRLVARLARLRPLWGNCPESLTKVRNPEWLADTLEGTGVGFPQTMPAVAAVGNLSGEWLCKPRRSGGGLGIHRLRRNGSTNPASSGPWLQRFIAGEPLSAAFLARDGEATWISAAEQWVGTTWGAPGEFQYAGGLAPAPITAAEQARLLDVAQRLTTSAGLRGLFGLDLVRAENRLCLIEVNPRYTASMELHERSLGRCLMAEHCAAFGAAVANAVPANRPTNQFHAKLIVYAARAGAAGTAFRDALKQLSQHGITAADIPVTDSPIPAGSPICTLLASNETPAPLRQSLLTASQHVRTSVIS
jgi:predicted ATP-grasp superfamily ATP-dependent carboligase